MRIIFFFITLLLVRGLIYSQSYSPEIEQKIKQVETSLAAQIRLEGDTLRNLQEQMQMYKLPSVSIAVIKNYKLEWARAYGFADKSTNTIATTNTLYQAASISKSLNGVGAMLLVQEKKIDLNTDINQYLTTWKYPYDSSSGNQKITLGNLLSHTAGLSIHGFPGYETADTLPTVLQIINGEHPANTKAVRSMFPAGEKVQYSGGGTTISQLLITDITKKNYAAYMQEKVLNPIGMTSSFYNQPPPAGKQKQLATAYDMNGNEIKGKYHVYPEQAAAGLWTNPVDLSKYIIETQRAYAGKSAKVLDQQTTRLRLKPFLADEAALGVFTFKKDEESWFSHGGSNAGFRCTYFGSLETGNGVVVMVNSDNGAIIDEIVNSVASVYDWKKFYTPEIKKKITVPDSVLSKYTGTYEMRPGFNFDITIDSGQLFVEATGESKVPMYAENESMFFVLVVDAKFEFVKNTDGKVDKLILHHGSQRECKRIK